MSIPTNITREHVLKAIEKIDSKPELKNKRGSSTYDLIFEGKKYPPILVLSIANQLNNGKELLLSDFDNNIEKPFNLLRENGFSIIPKKNNYDQTEQALIEYVQTFDEYEWFDEFFGILEHIISEASLQDNDQKIAFTLVKVKKRISINIGARLIFAICRTKKVNWFYVMLNAADIVEARKLSEYYTQEEEDTFKSGVEASLIPFTTGWSTTSKLWILKAFSEAVNAQLPAVKSAGQPEKHNNFIYQAAVDLNYRIALNQKIDENMKANNINNLDEQVMVYCVSSSASSNAIALTSIDEKYFYWNDKTFKSLQLGDYIFVVNVVGKKVLLTKLDKIDINITSSDDENSFFTDLKESYTVSGKYDKFIRLHIIKTIETPTEWKWKSLGSSETTYLKGVRVNTDKRENRILNIQQLKQLSDDIEYNRVLDTCMLNFTNRNDILIPEIVAAIKQNTTSISTDFHAKTNEAGLIFSQQLIQRFIASLCTKPFVICSGLSGSGKTKLAQAFVQWISESERQYKIIPVGADWTNREPLLGYPNALQSDKYVKPENGVLDLINSAMLDETKPYFLILDEMNLSHVERYFADFLSTMESGDAIPLHNIDAEEASENGIPKQLKLPKNLFIIGTVNIDETTYMFSPKVLDRANTIEFRLTEKNLEDFIDSKVTLDMDLLKGEGAVFGEVFIEMARKETDKKNLKKVETDLKDFFKELKKSGAEFGYRSASEIGRLMFMLEELGEKEDNLLDIAIMQKLLPKIHGSRNKLSKVLPVLGGFCLKNNELIKEKYLDMFVNNTLTEEILNKDSNIKYRISFQKICRMYKNAVENGFASYAEA